MPFNMAVDAEQAETGGRDLTRIKHAFIKILTGSDLSRRRLPLMTAESPNPGPVLWLTACCHGDEVGGIFIVHEIFRKIRKHGLLRGKVYAFPLMNPIGFETISRTITLSKEDLNRSFPGSEDGTLGERIAHIIYRTIIDTRPTLVIDLHNDWIRSIPYALVDPYSGVTHNETYKKILAFAKNSGFPVIREQQALPGALTYNLLRQDIPSLTLELGEPYVVNEKYANYGVRSIWNIMHQMRLTAETIPPFAYPLPKSFQRRVLRYLDRPYSAKSGIARYLVNAGDCVSAGQAVAKIYNAFGKLSETIRAAEDAIVLGHADTSVAFPGMAVMAYGVISRKTDRNSDNPKN